MNGINCGYYHHKFEKKGPLVNTHDDVWMQEMECSKCGITTYYPEEAFTIGNQ